MGERAYTPARLAVMRIQARRRGEHVPEPAHTGPLKFSHTSGLPAAPPPFVPPRRLALSLDDFCRLVPDSNWYVQEHGCDAPEAWLRVQARGLSMAQRGYLLGRRQRLSGGPLSELLAIGLCDHSWRLTELGCAMRRYLRRWEHEHGD